LVVTSKRNPRFDRIIGCGQSGAAILTVYKPSFGQGFHVFMNPSIIPSYGLRQRINAGSRSAVKVA